MSNMCIYCRRQAGWTALHIASSAGKQTCVLALLEFKYEYKQCYPHMMNDSTCRADVNSLTGSKVSSLHYAASKNHAEIAAILLDHGADINTRDSIGATPLHRACTMFCD